MEPFAKQVVHNLKPFQSLWLFSECKFSEGERYFGSNCQGCSKTLSSKSWKNTCEEVDFFKLQARNLQLYKNQGNSQVFFKDFGCTLFWGLYRQPLSSWKFHLLWHQNYFDLDESSHFQIYSPFGLTHPLIMRFFQPPPPPLLSIFWRLCSPHL